MSDWVYCTGSGGPHLVDREVHEYLESYSGEDVKMVRTGSPSRGSFEIPDLEDYSVGVGHSAGGLSLARNVYESPDSWDRLVLLDPVTAVENVGGESFEQRDYHPKCTVVRAVNSEAKQPLKPIFESWSSQGEDCYDMRLVQGADHSFEGCFDEVKAILADVLGFEDSAYLRDATSTAGNRISFR
ncbi:MAG: hypothetical protein ABEJ83_04870 [Candidatus Nanohaloarchaea archaeon]